MFRSIYVFNVSVYVCVCVCLPIYIYNMLACAVHYVNSALCCHFDLLNLTCSIDRKLVLISCERCLVVQDEVMGGQWCCLVEHNHQPSLC